MYVSLSSKVYELYLRAKDSWYHGFHKEVSLYFQFTASFSSQIAPPPFAPPQIPCGAQSMRCEQAHHVLPFTTLQLLVASFRWCTLQEETAQAECRVGDRHENKAHGAGDDDDPHDVRVSRVADVCDSLHVIRLAKTSAKEGTGSSARVGGLRERQRTERRRRRERDTAMERVAKGVLNEERTCKFRQSDAASSPSTTPFRRSVCSPSLAISLCLLSNAASEISPPSAPRLYV